ncbi:hypothetical protein AAIH50_22680, partial [Pseudomonas aeruginosa]
VPTGGCSQANPFDFFGKRIRVGEQVTRMHTTFEFCMDVVNNGYFDDTRMPPTYASGNSTRGLITSPSVDPATAIERGRAATSPTPGDAFSTRVTIVPDSSRTPRTL